MTTEHKPVEITKEQWIEFIQCWDWVTRDCGDISRSPISPGHFDRAKAVGDQLHKFFPVLARDAEQLPRLRLKRKNQRTAYRQLQTAYERVLKLWEGAALRNGLVPIPGTSKLLMIAPDKPKDAA